MTLDRQEGTRHVDLEAVKLVSDGFGAVSSKCGLIGAETTCVHNLKTADML
jgi:hypothetical protein